MPIRLTQVPAGWFVLDGEKVNDGSSPAVNMRDILRLEQGGAVRRKERVLTITEYARMHEWLSYYKFESLIKNYAYIKEKTGKDGSITYNALPVMRVCIADYDALELTYLTGLDGILIVIVKDFDALTMASDPNPAIGAVEFYHPDAPPTRF